MLTDSIHRLPATHVAYRRRPRRPPRLRVLSEGTGVTSSTTHMSMTCRGAAHTDAANLHAGTGEGTQGRLGPGAGSLGAVAAGRADLDVQRVDAELLALDSDVLGGQHGGVRRRLVTVSLHLHPTGDADNGLTASQIGYVHKGVVEGGKDAGDAEDELTGTDLGTERDNLLNLDLAGLLPDTALASARHQGKWMAGARTGLKEPVSYRSHI